MALTTRPQLPAQLPITNDDGTMTNRFYFWLNSLSLQAASANAVAVSDGSISQVGPTTIFQGADSAKGAPGKQDIFFGLDDGTIYTVNPTKGSWQLQSPEYIGDVTKAAGSNTLVLPNINLNVGTYNGFTINAKGQITSAADATITKYVGTNQQIVMSPNGGEIVVSLDNNPIVSGNITANTYLGDGSNLTHIRGAIVSESQPTNNVEGQIWYNPTTETIHYYANDQWQNSSLDGEYF